MCLRVRVCVRVAVYTYLSPREGLISGFELKEAAVTSPVAIGRPPAWPCLYNFHTSASGLLYKPTASFF